MTRPMRMTRSRSRLALNGQLAPEMYADGPSSAPGGTFTQSMDRNVRSAPTLGTVPTGYYVSQSAAQSQLSCMHCHISLPRLTVPSLSNGSSSSSSSGYTPLVTPTDESSYQLGDKSDGHAAVLTSSGTILQHGMLQQPVHYPSYPPPIAPYPGRSFPPMTINGQYFDEKALLPELCGALNLPPPMHGRLPPLRFLADQRAGTVWRDPSVPELRPAPTTLWGELFGRDEVTM
ncbi:hypothetical protein EVJ58_g5184 [Rhodofomes roseus]|uniref:Uncharacterized protein n=1 Tax=Rhodofomes roseus TaxID=34475 RepID=A0A4Y9YCW7_9APHY|nr:hypothetical protein EVJ58_g5184 [Rhodofomes roseus]